MSNLCGARASLWTRSIIVLALTAIATSASAEWRRIDSPNFVVVGDVGARTLHDIAVKFEGFRETLSRVLSQQATGTAVPTVVVVFPSERAFAPFKPRFKGKTVDVDGLFVGGRDVNYIAVRSDTGDEGLRVVFHEYAHLIISNIGRNIPAWLSEGLAEYYSTYEVMNGGKEADIGKPLDSHIYILNVQSQLPLAELLKVDHDSPLYNEGDRRSVFYAQSWALTHMLLRGDPPRGQQLEQYLIKVGEGVPAYDAWQQVMGALPIENDLQKYVRLRSFRYYRYKFPEKLATFEGTAAALPAGDAEAFLSDFLLQQKRADEAIARLAKSPKGSAATPWSAVVGALALQGKDDAAAEEQLLSIPDAADWLAAYRAGAAIADIIEDRQETPSAGSVQAARRLFDIARNGRDLPNAAARLATIELAADDDLPASTRGAIERARQQAPGRTDYVFLLARVLAAQSEFVEARNVLSPLMTSAYPPDIREPARSLMGYIVRIEQAEAARRAATAARAAAPPSGPAGASRRTGTDQPGVMRPIFRTLGAGESRLEGTLERIECVKTGATFHVGTSDGLVHVTAPRMQEVEFLTFRDDLGGSVRCGQMKQRPRVYVTWKPGAETGSRVAVAIEFLPQ